MAKRQYIRYVTDEKLSKVNPNNLRWIERYFNSKGSNLSETSRKGYQSDFNQWMVYIMENYDNTEITKFETEDAVDMIEDFIAFCRSVLGNNERRIQRRLSSISSFYLYLKRRRKITENPLDFIERPSIRVGEKPQIKQTFLTEEQVKEIRQKLKQLGNLQLELYFEFGLSTMARANAIASVRVDQIDFENEVITGVKEKEGYIVDLLPSERTMKLIKEWLAYRKQNGIDSEYLFITKYRGEWKKVNTNTIQTVWIKKIGELIGIPELHSHDLRHSGANLLYHRGLSLEEVQELLNHKSPTVTQQHYLQTNLDKLKKNKKFFEI